MTSRFREELAPSAAGATSRRAGAAEAVAGAIQATVATAGRAVFFSGLTVLLGLLGLVLFEFTILRSVGIAGAIVVGAGGPRGADPAAGDPVDPRAAPRPAGGPPGRPPDPARERALGPPRPAGDAPAGRRASSRRSASCSSSASPFLHVRFNAPDATILPAGGALAGRLRPARRRTSGRASSPRSSLAIRTTGPATEPGQRRGPVRLLAAARGRSRGSPAWPASSTSTRG